MLDVHVLTHSKTRDEWLDRCLNSLRGQPCVVHVIEGVERDIAAGRRIGFSAGVEKYVSFVDSDDYVMPGAFDVVLAALNSGVPALCSLERVINESGQTIKVQGGHHLYAARRDLIASVLDRFCNARFAHCFDKLHALTAPQQIDSVLYVYQLHADQSYPRIAGWAQTEHMRSIWQRHQTSLSKLCQTDQTGVSFSTVTQPVQA